MTHPVLLLLLIILPLALASASATAAATYYCDRSGQPTRITQPPPEFLLVTGYANSSYLTPNARCQFTLAAPANGSMFQLLMERNPSLPTWARLTIREGDSATAGRVLAVTDDRSGSDRRVPLERTVLIGRPGREISVTLETASGHASQETAVWLRVRRFVNCPPGWTDLDGQCFSPLAADGADGSGRQLDYATAQVACNAMRANLLMMSFRGGAKYIGNYSLTTFFTGKLGYRYDAWVGLVDNSHGALQWLDGTWYRDSIWPDGLRCASSLSWLSQHCRDSERCAYVRAVSTVYIGPVLDTCRYPSATRRFACYMPRNGTDTFYRLPGNGGVPLLHWLLPTVIGCAILCVIVLLLVAMQRQRRRRHLLLHGGAGLDGCRQPILVVVPPPHHHQQHQQHQPPPPAYDVHGRPVQWYGAVGVGGQQIQQDYQQQQQQQQQKK